MDIYTLHWLSDVVNIVSKLTLSSGTLVWRSTVAEKRCTEKQSCRSCFAPALESKRHLCCQLFTAVQKNIILKELWKASQSCDSFLLNQVTWPLWKQKFNSRWPPVQIVKGHEGVCVRESVLGFQLTFYKPAKLHVLTTCPMIAQPTANTHTHTHTEWAVLQAVCLWWTVPLWSHTGEKNNDSECRSVQWNVSITSCFRHR